ncbi:50S ribosomal protein L17 [Cytophagaceae bacterium DM2B3-1]|uniref:Large ribosomal subunit protein bL17 n=1 Tax=Xanthocytophaga flava TaxID=3048013 RepID=A0ABT7CG14_9BACT|nr:50S ribosomal protein L17 [Xanthocytophaga flavus]MDJ1466690.1 50S ribosomal protein L17 [Xanthocytophaga flavus]MDJ1492686.1 50S ribosomal protein L17 [Xanthocytophaga flavus]
MRHGKTDNHLGRTVGHRRALLSNMASSLILHKRIKTTVAKAKELRKYVEPLLTKAKDDTTHSRRVVFSYLQNKESVKVLFGDVAEKIANREGGYTRIIKLGNRLGDNADMCLIELVDYNETLLNARTEAKTKTRRSRRGSTGKAKVEEATVLASDASAETEKPAITEVSTDTEVTETKE